MPEQKRKKQFPQLVHDLSSLVVEQRKDADEVERKLKLERKKMSDRDFAVEDFLKKEQGSLARYNAKREWHIETEKMPEKDIVIEEDIPTVS